MRFAFCVMTQYQLMNCINFVWYNIEGSRGKGDLYIYENIRMLFKKLKKKICLKMYIYSMMLFLTVWFTISIEPLSFCFLHMQ